MIKTVLIDLSGTLHVENQAIPGALEALKKLQGHDLTLRFVTNTTKESRRFLHERLTKLGFPVKVEDIHSSLLAARALIVKRELKPMLLLSPEALEDFEGLACGPSEKPNAVVVGLAPDEFNYERLTEAFRHLLGGAKLIAVHAGKYYKRFDGLALGPGCFVKGLEYSAQCKAELVGKPNRNFFRSALPEGCRPEEAVMIGDDVTDDVEGALLAGMKAILVKTGKYRKGDESKISINPTAIVADFPEAVEKILHM